MGSEYENAFREKAESLLTYLHLETLKDLGITMVLIAFSADGSTTFCASPKGEIVFVFNNNEARRKMNYETFETVITHELFHLYIDHNLNWGISPKLHHAFTFVSGEAVKIADDIELIKIAVEKRIEPLLLDEVNRTNAYYKNLPDPVPMKYWTGVADYMKFDSMMSVTWTYASTQWLSQKAEDPELIEGFAHDLTLVQPHYEANGLPKLKELIVESLDSKIVETEEEAEDAVKRILDVFDEFLTSNRMDLQ
jgi:hypothetical protein